MSAVGLEIEGLSRRYGRRWALADVTFQVPAASALMISGRNGAGKSTLLRVLATAIKPDRGVVRVGGFDVVEQREDVRKLTAILSHHNYLYESLTARENLAVVADHLRVGRDRIDATLGEVGLAARASDLVATFSAGMRKRLSFARILLQEPRVVLLDEPYGALDPAGFDLVDNFIRAFRTRGATVLFATHQLERSAKLADANLVLEEGRVVAC
jgi:heme exporter protein A